jgi:hypothetical protein
MIKISLGAIEFPLIEMQEQAQTLSHIDLVLSQLPMIVLKGLQTSVMQKKNLCVESKVMELTKVTNDKAKLHTKYNKFMMEQDEAKNKEERIQYAIQKVYNDIPEVPMEIDAPIEEKVSNISESIQGFHANIVDLEACTTPGTPPKEREKTSTTTVENIKSLEEECAKL